MGTCDDLSSQARKKSCKFKTCLRMEVRFWFLDERERMWPYRRPVLPKPAVIQHALNLERCEAPGPSAVKSYRQRTAARI